MEKICYKCAKEIEGEPCEGLHRACFCEWFQTTEPQPFYDLIARTDKRSDEWSAITFSFFHGKFRKYSARLAEKSYLLKVQQPEIPELPATEYLCNQIARTLLLNVPDHYFIRFQNELDAFVCENFMDKYPGGNLVHIYRFLERPDQFSCEGLVHVLEKQVKRYQEIQRFIKLSLFDALIGNHDRHGRNLGLIQFGKELLLAPFYDNPSYLALEDPLLLGALHEPRGVIITQETKEPTMSDYVKEWKRLGLIEPVHEFHQTINRSKIEDLVARSFLSGKRKQAFLQLINRRYHELSNAIERFS